MPIHTNRHRLIPIIVVFLVGIALSLIAYRQANFRENQELRKEFALASQNRTATIEREINANLAALSSVAAYSEVDEPLTPAEFERFAERIRRLYPTILALEYLPARAKLETESV